MSRGATTDRRPPPLPRPASPPALGRWLLRRICAAAYLETVEGDTEELFRLRLRTSGRVRATLRYFADVASVATSGPPHPDPQRRRRAPFREVIVDTLLQDLRFAARGLTKSPAFAAVVVLTLGLGIGANTAIFSVVNGVLLQPLPYDQPDRIVQIAEIDPTVGSERARDRSMASQRLFLAWRDSGDAFDELAMYTNQAATLTGRDEPVRLTGVAASPALFRVLGVSATEGRTFTDDEEVPGNDGVIVLSSRTLQRYFGGDLDIVGRQVQLDDRSRTVLGVMPPGFDFPDPSIEYWVPMVIQPLGPSAEGALEQESAREVREERGVVAEPAGPGGPGPGGPGPGGPGPEPADELHHIELWGRLVGRLADGIELTRAAEEGTSVLRGTRTDIADDTAHVDLVILQDELVGPVRSSLTLLMGAVGFVLLIACANVANLVMARSAGRSKETAVRSALGAGKLQLVRLLLVEGIVLAALGGIVGLAITAIGLQMLRSVGPEFIPRLESVSVDSWALGFTAAVALLTGVLFSLMPARGATALDLTRALKQDGPTGGGGGRDAFRKVLVTVEVALSVVLLIGAGLLVSSFARLALVDPGYDPENVLSVSLQIPQTRYSTAEAYRGFFDQSIAALELIPGIEAVTLASVSPTDEANIRISIDAQGDPERPDQPPAVFSIRVVESSYFESLRMRLVAGRFFGADDRADGIPVAVVNESAALELFPDEEPVGQLFPGMGGGELEIVGVVADVRTAGVDPKASPELFLPISQAPDRMIPGLFRSSSFLIRTGPAPLSVLPAVRARMAQIDAQVPLFRASTMRDQIADSVAEPRFYAALVSAFAGIAVALAAVGIYGLLSYSVQQAVRETAIRRALGAQAGEILRRVVGQGMLLAVVGLTVGVAGAIGLSRLLESMLYEIEPTDPLTLAVATALFLVIALLAILVPARRATRIDPMEALRYDG